MTIGIGRRQFISALGGAVGSWPLATRAQQPAMPARVGFLGGASTPAGKALTECFRSGLLDAGWTEAKNITIEYQWTEGVQERYP